jgi:hypothetical protein
VGGVVLVLPYPRACLAKSDTPWFLKTGQELKFPGSLVIRRHKAGKLIYVKGLLRVWKDGVVGERQDRTRSAKKRLG